MSWANYRTIGTYVWSTSWTYYKFQSFVYLFVLLQVPTVCQLYGPGGLLTPQPGPAATLLFWSPFKSSSLFIFSRITLYMGQINIPISTLTKNLKMPTRNCTPYLIVRVVRCSILSFSLEKINLHSLKNCASKYARYMMGP